MENINFTKKVFEKTQYKKVIPTQFTQLRVETPSAIVTASLPSINQFFDFYNQLFYEIPQTGDVNSHEYLINQSSTYVGFSQSQEEIQALLDEIESLRIENLQLNREIANIQISGSNGGTV